MSTTEWARPMFTLAKRTAHRNSSRFIRRFAPSTWPSATSNRRTFDSSYTRRRMGRQRNDEFNVGASAHSCAEVKTNQDTRSSCTSEDARAYTRNKWHRIFHRCLLELGLLPQPRVLAN